MTEEADILDRLQAAMETPEGPGPALVAEVIGIITWGRRREVVLVDTLQMFRKEFFDLAVTTEKEALASQLLDRRRDYRQLSNSARDKVRYIENVLAYTGEQQLTPAVEKPKVLN